MSASCSCSPFPRSKSTRHHGRLGVELEISVPGRASFGGADGVLRSLDRLRDRRRAALRRFAQPHRYRDGAGRRHRHPDGLPNSLFDWHWLALFPLFIIFFISALAETNRPPFDLPEAESELVAGFMVEYGSTPYMMFMLGEYAAIVLMCALTTILFLGGWLPPLRCVVPSLGAGHRLVRAQGLPRVLHVLHGQGLRAALPLRPADAAWLEGVPADFAGHAGDRGLRSQADGNRPVILITCFSIRLIKPRQERRLTMLAQAAKSLFLKEFVGAFFLSMRYFFARRRP
jgi:hypothetical protein